MNAEDDLSAVCKATMEEAAIAGRPNVISLLEVSREMIVEKLQSIESLLKLPDRGLAINIWSKWLCNYK